MACGRLEMDGDNAGEVHGQDEKEGDVGSRGEGIWMSRQLERELFYQRGELSDAGR